MFIPHKSSAHAYEPFHSIFSLPRVESSLIFSRDKSPTKLKQTASSMRNIVNRILVLVLCYLNSIPNALDTLVQTLIILVNMSIHTPSYPHYQITKNNHYAITASGRRWLAPLAPFFAPGRASVYLAKARARAFLQLTFWLATKLSTVTAIARSISCAEQYSERRIRQNASLIRMMASR